MGNCLAGAGTQWEPGCKYDSNKHDRELLKKSIMQGLAPAYRVQELLGHGAEGNTWLVEDVNTGKPWAMKLIQLPLPPKLVQALLREVQLQSQLGEGHHNIITPQEVVLTDSWVGLVMEYAPAGNLTQYVTTKYKLCGGKGLLMPEDEARYYFKQVVSAVDYCHKHHVAHRDLKLDNTLLSGHNPPYIKLCDFGFARSWGGDDCHFATVIGTPDYMAPQLTGAKANSQQAAAQAQALYDGTKADVWAMGVLLCVMLIGRFPFEGNDTATAATAANKDVCAMQKVWRQQTKSTRWHHNELLTEQLTYLSPEARDLLDAMFELNEAKRISVQGIMQHPWFTAPMRPEYEAALLRLKQEQEDTERKVAAGAYRSAQRDAAIKSLIDVAASTEFKQAMRAPVGRDTTFHIWTRVNLRTVEDYYPSFNRDSLRACIQRSRRTSLVEPPNTPPMLLDTSLLDKHLATVDSPASSQQSSGLPTLQVHELS